MSRSNASHRHPHTNNFKTITNIEKRVLSNEINETINPNTDNAHDLGVGGLTWRSANIRKVRLMGNDDVTDQYDETGTLFIAGGLAATDTIACTTILADNLESITGLTFTFPLSRAPGPPNPILSLLYDGTTLQLNGTNQLKVSVDGTTLKYITSALGFNLDNRTLKYNAGITKVEVDAAEVFADTTIQSPLAYASDTLQLRYDENTLQLEGGELAVAIDNETLVMSAVGGELQVNLDNRTLIWDAGNTHIEVDAGEIFQDIIYSNPVSYNAGAATLSVKYDNETIELDGSGKLRVSIDATTLKVTGESPNKVIGLNYDNVSLGYDTDYNWLHVDHVVLSMGGIKKFKIQEVLAATGFLDLATFITAIQTAEEYLGLDIIPAGKTSTQIQSFLTHSEYVSVATDDISMRLTTPISASVPIIGPALSTFSKLVFGRLECFPIKTANHGIGRIPFYGTTTLDTTSGLQDGYLEWDNSNNIFKCRNLQIGRDTTIGAIWYNSSSAGNNLLLTEASAANFSFSSTEKILKTHWIHLIHL